MLAKLFDLSGRAALVTGGSKGLGKAMALGFARAGADVFISSRHENELQTAAREIRSASTGRVEYAVADMSHRDQADQLAQAAIEALGRVDILVNNAGIRTRCTFSSPICTKTDPLSVNNSRATVSRSRK